MRGTIIKGIGGFYYVKTETGIIQAKGRGIFRKQKITLMVGDEVELEILDDGDGVINSVFDRKNCFDRPPIANVDALLLVFAAAEPTPSFLIIDKFLIMAEKHGVEAAVCINKSDLAEEQFIEDVKGRYLNRYKVLTICAKDKQGISEIREFVKGKKCALAGPSGVGKSTITNILIPEAEMETSHISYKLNRGRNTTRHVEIFDLPEGGMIYDTPGFTSFDISGISEDELMYLYPEIAEYTGNCRFDNCRHVNEPDCKVKQAVEAGKINKDRYLSYVKIYGEIKENSVRR